MSLHPCYISKCKEESLFTCSCSKRIFICYSHVQDHLTTIEKHILKNYATIIPQEFKPKISEYFLKNLKIIKENIKVVKAYTTKTISQILNESASLIKKLQEEKAKLNKTFQSFLCKSLVNSEITDIVFKKKKTWMDYYDLKLVDLETNIKKVYNFSLKNEKSYDATYALVFSSTEFNKIEMIHLETFQTTLKYYDSGIFPFYCVCCKIDEENNYFVYGGGNDGMEIDSAKIINLGNNNVKVLSSNEKLNVAGGCLFNREIYVFGGFNSSAMKSSKKYSLNDNVWTSIAPLPEANYSNSASNFNNAIYVSGFHSSDIFKYLPDENVFKIIKTNNNPKSSKFIFENWLVCFQNSLYEIDNNENLLLAQQFKDKGGYLNSSGYFRRGFYLYFILDGPKLYRIDVKQRKIEQVQIFRSLNLFSISNS